jgi:hypothetical protein
MDKLKDRWNYLKKNKWFILKDGIQSIFLILIMLPMIFSLVVMIYDYDKNHLVKFLEWFSAFSVAFTYILLTGLVLSRLEMLADRKINEKEEIN